MHVDLGPHNLTPYPIFWEEEVSFELELIDS